MKRGAWFAGAVAAMATCTWVVAWWMVPVVAAIWGWIRRRDAAMPLLAGLAGLTAWALLVAITSRAGAGASVMDAVGTAMRVGPGPLLALTLAYGALLAASAAAVVRAIWGGRAS